MLGDAYSKAWNIFKDDMGSWVAFFAVFALIAGIAGSIIPLIGGLGFLPIAIRETSRAVSEGRAPNIPALWDFSNIGGDFITMLLYGLAQTVGILMCFVGWPIAWIGFWYSAELAADGRVSPTDAMKLSWAFAKSNLTDTVGMALVSSMLISAGASFGVGLGMLVTGPLVLLAYSVYWMAVRDQVYALANARGIAVKGAPSIPTTPALIPAETDGTLGDIDLSPRGEMDAWQQKFDDR